MKRSESKDLKISAIIIAKNAEGKINNCLESLGWVDEVVVVDTGSNDKTKEIVFSFKAKFYPYDKGSYSEWRNYGKEKASGEYLLYVDTDEVVDSALEKEIKFNVLKWPDDISCYAIPRKNIIFGKWLKHGGWYPDYVIRLFKKNELVSWENVLHEQPKYKGQLGYLKNPLIHHKENTLEDMVVKTNKWSDIEAKLMFDANHPPMNIRRFLSAMFREFWNRFVKNLAFLDGGEGIIMGIYQVYSRFISYAKLWELQINNSFKSKID
jgi:glycosyltransferase involved in cell wall biosynthesis